MASNKYLKLAKRLLRVIPDRKYIQLYYFAKFRKFPNLKNPSTYNEKLQWLKLHYWAPGSSRLVDKHDVKNIVRDAIGDDFIIPTIGVYETADQIDFDDLPQSFVLKCTHDSEGVVIVPNKCEADFDEIREKLRRALAHDFFWIGREPHYRGIEPRIIAEPFLIDDAHGELLDYKFFCFDGEVKVIFIASGRSSGETKFDYFSAEFLPLDIRQTYPKSSVPPDKPECYDEMIAIAREVSKGHPHVRVDLYEVNGRVYFGELTFFHFSGFAPFDPAEEDLRWGEWLKLPKHV